MDMNNSTQGNETFTWTSPIPLHTRIALPSILLAWSLLGNVLVIAVVYCNQNLRTNMNYLIVNMAVSDLLIPLVGVPWCFAWYMKRPSEWFLDGPLGAALCKLVPFFTRISPFVSSISLVIIAFHRYIVVVYPTRQQIFRSRKSRWIMISFPWIVAMTFLSPLFYTYRLTNEWGYTMCDFSWSPAFDYWTAQTLFFSIQTAVGFVIPLILITIWYSIIIHKLRESLKNVMGLIKVETILARQIRNRRLFNMSITIVLVFAICWCPYRVFKFYLLSVSRSHPSIWMMMYDHLLKWHFAVEYIWLLLAAINPCIYFVFLRDFRQGLKRVCCRKTARGILPTARQPRPPGGDSRKNLTSSTQPHIINTSV